MSTREIIQKKIGWRLLLVTFCLTILSFDSLHGQKNKDYRSWLYTNTGLPVEEGHLYELRDSSLVIYSLKSTLRREYKIKDVAKIGFQEKSSAGGRLAVGGLVGSLGGILFTRASSTKSYNFITLEDLGGAVVGFFIGSIIGLITVPRHTIYINGDQRLYETKKKDMMKYLVEF